MMTVAIGAYALSKTQTSTFPKRNTNKDFCLRSQECRSYYLAKVVELRGKVCSRGA